MNLHFDSALDIFLYFIIFVKIIFILSAIGHVILTYGAKNKHLIETVDPKLMYWKERTEFVFIASMAILLIYHFRPSHKKPVSNESALLFFLFGWVLLVTAKWELFFTEANWYKEIVSSIR
jgi:uncharacterized membrane protein YgdD (TMEM256/DUF423 family)